MTWLVDDYVIAEKQNVTREVGQATKIGIVMQNYTLFKFSNTA